MKGPSKTALTLEETVHMLEYFSLPYLRCWCHGQQEGKARPCCCEWWWWDDGSCFILRSLDPGQRWTNRVDYSSRACSQAGFCEKFGKIYKFWKWILMCDQFLTTQTIAPFILFISQPSLYPPSTHKSFIETSYIWILIGELVSQVKS